MLIQDRESGHMVIYTPVDTLHTTDMIFFNSYLVLLVFLFKSSQSASFGDEIINGGTIPIPRLERQIAQSYDYQPNAEDIEAVTAYLDSLDRLPSFPSTTPSPAEISIVDEEVSGSNKNTIKMAEPIQ